MIRKVLHFINEYINLISVGCFLGFRQILRANPWTSILIVFIMTLTFLNLVVVRGILVGLIEGSSVAYHNNYSSDVLISKQQARSYLPNSHLILDFLENNPAVDRISPRYLVSTTIRSSIQPKDLKPGEVDTVIGTSAAGIDPEIEDSLTHLSHLMIDGSYLTSSDVDSVVVGSGLMAEYAPARTTLIGFLEGIKVGSKIRVTINKVPRDVLVKGILRSKVSEVNRRLYFNASDLKRYLEPQDYNYAEIAAKVRIGIDPALVTSTLKAQGVDAYALPQTSEESQGEFFRNLSMTFGLLGTVIGSIGLVIATITIFIVVFINAITRRKYIGILKAIGIRNGSIELAYVMQAFWYAFLGAAIGCFLVFAVLKPYFDQHPINFPFSDGILVATWDETLMRVYILFAVTALAGFIPARMIVRKNTLDAILGR